MIMSDTFSQMYCHLVFAVQGRYSLISHEWEAQLYKYITSIVQNNGHKLLAIGGMPDHIHLFIGYNIVQSIPELVREVKRDSASWINNQKFVFGRFSWQRGYGVFSYSRSQIQAVANYINHQEKHHSKQSFLDEYKKTLDHFDVIYEDKYLFKPVE
jgi:putative transposase